MIRAYLRLYLNIRRKKRLQAVMSYATGAGKKVLAASQKRIFCSEPKVPSTLAAKNSALLLPTLACSHPIYAGRCEYFPQQISSTTGNSEGQLTLKCLNSFFHRFRDIT